MSQHESHDSTEQNGEIVPSYDGINGPIFPDSVDTTAHADIDKDGYYVAYIPDEEHAQTSLEVQAGETVDSQSEPAPRFWTPRELDHSDDPSDDSRELYRTPNSVIQARQSASGRFNHPA